MVTDEALAQEVLALTPETSLREVPGFVERMALVPQNAIVTFASDSAAAGAYGFGSAATGLLGFGPGMDGETQDAPDTGWTVGSFACNPMRFVAGGSRTDGDLSRTVSIIEEEAPATCG